MTSREFCYWLQGFFEIEKAGSEGGPKIDRGLIGAKVETIERHLALVFKHEIDPSYPNSVELDKTHGAGAGKSTPRC